MNEADAIEFDKYVAGIKDKLYTPKLEDIVKRPDLYTVDRMYSRCAKVRDFDDEKQNRAGESVGDVIEETKTLVSEIKE